MTRERKNPNPLKSGEFGTVFEMSCGYQLHMLVDFGLICILRSFGHIGSSSLPNSHLILYLSDTQIKKQDIQMQVVSQ